MERILTPYWFWRIEIEASCRHFTFSIRFICSRTSYLVDPLTSRLNGLAATIELVKAAKLWSELSGAAERLVAESSLKPRSWNDPYVKVILKDF